MDELNIKLLHRAIMDDDDHSALAAIRALRRKFQTNGVDPFKIEMGIKQTPSQISGRYDYYNELLARQKSEIELYRDWATHLIRRWRQQPVPRFFLSRPGSGALALARDRAHDVHLRLVKGRISPERYALVEYHTDVCWVADIQLEEVEYWISTYSLLRHPTLVESLRERGLHFDRQAYEDVDP